MFDNIIGFLATYAKKREVVISGILAVVLVLWFLFYRIEKVEASLEAHESMLIESNRRLDRNYDKIVEISENLASVDNQVLLVLGEIRDEVGYLRGRMESMDRNIN